MASKFNIGPYGKSFKTIIFLLPPDKVDDGILSNFAGINFLTSFNFQAKNESPVFKWKIVKKENVTFSQSPIDLYGDL